MPQNPEANNHLESLKSLKNEPSELVEFITEGESDESEQEMVDFH